MNSLIPDSHADLLADDKRAFAFLATVMPDHSPQVTPVWFDIDGDLICINTARGRVKDRNMTVRHNVALAIIDPQDPYRYLQVRGRVQEVTEEGARTHIDRLAGKYLGKAEYPWYQGEQRVTYKILPVSVSVS